MAMGLGKKEVFSLMMMMMMAFCGVSLGEIHKVGDSVGWANHSSTTGQVDYKSWSATTNFHVGDIILFEYNKEFNNVVRVTHKNYDACNATQPRATFTSGNDSFIIKKPGHFYFICSVPGHCQDGQKVDIRVLGPASIPGPFPSPSPAPSHKSSASSSSLCLTNGKLWLYSFVVLAFCVSGFAY